MEREIEKQAQEVISWADEARVRAREQLSEASEALQERLERASEEVLFNRIRLAKVLRTFKEVHDSLIQSYRSLYQGLQEEGHPLEGIDPWTPPKDMSMLMGVVSEALEGLKGPSNQSEENVEGGPTPLETLEMRGWNFDCHRKMAVRFGGEGPLRLYIQETEAKIRALEALVEEASKSSRSGCVTTQGIFKYAQKKGVPPGASGPLTIFEAQSMVDGLQKCMAWAYLANDQRLISRLSELIVELAEPEYQGNVLGTSLGWEALEIIDRASDGLARRGGK